VAKLEFLDYFERNEISGKIDEIESELKRVIEWNNHINSYLERGDLHGAIQYVDSSNLPSDQRQAICNRVQETIFGQEEQRRQAEPWIFELNRLLRERRFKEARKYVVSLPIEKHIKAAILAQPPKTSWLF